MYRIKKKDTGEVFEVLHRFDKQIPQLRGPYHLTGIIFMLANVETGELKVINGKEYVMQYSFASKD